MNSSPLPPPVPDFHADGFVTTPINHLSVMYMKVPSMHTRFYSAVFKKQKHEYRRRFVSLRFHRNEARITISSQEKHKVYGTYDMWTLSDVQARSVSKKQALPFVCDDEDEKEQDEEKEKKSADKYKKIEYRYGQISFGLIFHSEELGRESVELCCSSYVVRDAWIQFFRQVILNKEFRELHDHDAAELAEEAMGMTFSGAEVIAVPTHLRRCYVIDEYDMDVYVGNFLSRVPNQEIEDEEMFSPKRGPRLVDVLVGDNRFETRCIRLHADNPQYLCIGESSFPSPEDLVLDLLTLRVGHNFDESSIALCSSLSSPVTIKLKSAAEKQQLCNWIEAVIYTAKNGGWADGGDEFVRLGSAIPRSSSSYYNDGEYSSDGEGGMEEGESDIFDGGVDGDTSLTSVHGTLSHHRVSHRRPILPLYAVVVGGDPQLQHQSPVTSTPPHQGLKKLPHASSSLWDDSNNSSTNFYPNTPSAASHLGTTTAVGMLSPSQRQQQQLIQQSSLQKAKVLLGISQYTALSCMIR